MNKNLPKEESLVVEFKSDVKKYPDSAIFEAVVAFANTAGGDLYLGIEDDGTITGVHGQHKDIQTLEAYIANNTVPPIYIGATIIESTLPVLRITVPKYSDGIVATVAGKVLRRRIKEDGKPENIPMYPSEMTTRLSDLRLKDYSAALVTKANQADLDMLELARLRNALTTYDGDKYLLDLNDNELLTALEFARYDGEILVPTVAGILFLGKVSALKKYVPTYSVSVQVLTGTDVKVNEDFVLPILAAIEKVNAYLEVWNSSHDIELGMFRLSVPDFDKRAVREAVVNAFSHRDYSKMGRIRVAINDEGLTIANPGGFIEGITIDNLINAEPHGRNPLITDALKRLGLAERSGRGIDRIFEGSLRFGKLPPDYSLSTAVLVSLFIPRSVPDMQIAKLVVEEQRKLGKPLSLNMLLVLNELRDIPKSKITQIAEAVHLNKTIVQVIINEAVSRGFIEAYGTGSGRNYMLARAFFNDKEEQMAYSRQADINKLRYKELVVQYAKGTEYITRADIETLLHITKSQAYNLVKQLVKADLIELINSGHHAKYKIKIKK
ncbi:MAG: putative DNA binding domain-containing protein [Acidaminococcaceae bacterium]|nr:putative DNA binding domain-containing protein [Acidaminococcaceae bacterium]